MPPAFLPLWARVAELAGSVHTVPVLPDRPGRGVPIVEEVTPLEPLEVEVRLPDGDWSRGWLNMWQRDEHGWWGFVTTYPDRQPTNRWHHRSAMRLPSEMPAAEEPPAEHPPAEHPLPHDVLAAAEPASPLDTSSADLPATAAGPGDVPSGG